MTSRSLAQSGTRRVTAGDLTAFLSFESEIRTPDGYGGATKHWQPAAEAWAFAEPLFVGEREQLGAVRNVVQYRFTLYADASIDEQMRIEWNGKTYAIKGIRRGGPTELYMDVIAETGLAD